MKKICPLILFVTLLLCSCKAKIYNPEITDFEQSASVTSGIFSYTCKICRNNGDITVTATSTNAQGMRIFYNGEYVNFIYQDMEYQLIGNKIDKTNPAVAIYDVFNYITTAEELNVSKTENGFKYEGKTDLGNFVLLQNDDFTYNSLYFNNANLNIIFD